MNRIGRAVENPGAASVLAHRVLGKNLAITPPTIAPIAEPVQDGRIHIEKINAPFLKECGSPAEYKTALELAITRGWLWRHESGTYVKFTVAGAALFA